MKRISLAAALFAASIGLAAAHDTTPIEREMRHQSSLIEDGRRDGSLTWQEVKMLNDEQSRIAWMLTQARYDGTVTRREFDAICDAQESARTAIAYEVADRDSSPWRRRYADRSDRGYGDGYGYGNWVRRNDYGSGYDRGNGWGGWSGYGRGVWGYGRDRGSY